eukprot:m.194400 g.194400  ORF g.194400 m.194400 type:complete len:1763 (-) comp21786_c0_seq1:135-5423(-)
MQRGSMQEDEEFANPVDGAGAASDSDSEGRLVETIFDQDADGGDSMHSDEDELRPVTQRTEFYSGNPRVNDYVTEDDAAKAAGAAAAAEADAVAAVANAAAAAAAPPAAAAPSVGVVPQVVDDVQEQGLQGLKVNSPLSERKNTFSDGDGKSEMKQIEEWVTLNEFGDHSKFGVVKFNNRNKATFVRVSPSTAPERLVGLIKRLHFQLPRVVISVTGGAADFDLTRELESTLKRGLRRASEATNAWVITGGTNCGIMKYVGQAMSEIDNSREDSSVPLIGFATYGVIDGRHEYLEGPELEVEYNCSNPTALDKNHTHFFLVDDGSEEKFGREVGLKDAFEEHLRNCAFRGEKLFHRDSDQEKVYAVQLVVEGGPVTLDIVRKAVESRTPVVVLEGSGRAADLLSYAWRLLHDESPKSQFYSRAELTNNVRIVFPHFTSEQLKSKAQELLDIVIMKERVFIFSAEDNSELENAMLQAIISTIKPSKPDAETRYKLRRDKLQLAMSFDRVDIARKLLVELQTDARTEKTKRGTQLKNLEEEAFKEDKSDDLRSAKIQHARAKAAVKFLTLYGETVSEEDKPSDTAREFNTLRYRKLEERVRYKQDELNHYLQEDIKDALMWALRKNQPEFVQMFVPQVANMPDFLYSERTDPVTRQKSRRIEEIYDKRFRTRRQAYLSTILRRYQRDRRKRSLWKLITTGNIHGNEKLKLLEQVDQLIIDLIFTREKPAVEERDFSLVIGKKSNLRVATEVAFHDLMTWACLMDHYRLAELFWQLGGHSIANALFCSRIFLALSRSPVLVAHGEYLETRNKMERMAKKFETLAEGVLDACHQENSDRATLLLRHDLTKFRLLKKPNEGHLNCLELATEAEDRRFMSHSSCLSVVQEDWYGRLDPLTQAWQIWACIFFPPLLFTKMIRLKAPEAEPSTILSTQQNMTGQRSFKKRASARRSQDGGDTDEKEVTSYGFVEKGMSFLCAPVVKFYLEVIAYISLCILYTVVTLSPAEADHLSDAEYLLLFWMLVMMVEESRQVYSAGLVDWASDMWNRLDAAMYAMYIIAFCFRVYSLHTKNDSDLRLAKVLYALNMVQLLVRAMRLYAVSPTLGPKLIIIGKMGRDVATFMALLVVFLLSYGVLLHVLVFPQEELSRGSVVNVLYRPYFQMYGELMTDELSEQASCLGFFPFTDCTGFGAVIPFFLSVYLILSNIMLINLLIAMFSKTYDEVEEEALELWNFQLYELLQEFGGKPLLPPPISIVFFFYYALSSSFKWIAARIVSCKCTKSEEAEITPDTHVDEDDDIKAKLERFEEKHTERYLERRDRSSRESDTQRIANLDEGAMFIRAALNELASNARRAEKFQLELHDSLLLLRMDLAETLQGKPIAGQRTSSNASMLLRQRNSNSNLLPSANKIEVPPYLAGPATLEHQNVRGAKRYYMSPDRRVFNLPGDPAAWASFTTPSGAVVYYWKSSEKGLTNDEALLCLFDFELELLQGGKTVEIDGKKMRGEEALRVSRNSSGQLADRFPLEPEQVSWNTPLPNYAPLEYTAAYVLAQSKDAPTPFFKWADESEFSKVAAPRESYCGNYIDNGVPRNPVGRTGLTGRGLLGNWGPNRAQDMIVTRWKKNAAGGKVERGGKSMLEFLAVKRASEGVWAIPGGFGTGVAPILNKAFGLSESTSEVKEVEEIKQLLSTKSEIVFTGYMDDYRNTDNAWIETCTRHVKDDEKISKKPLMECRDAVVSEVSWITIHKELKLFAEHYKLIERVAIAENSYW